MPEPAFEEMVPDPRRAAEGLSGTQRAAVLLVALGTEAAGKVLKCLRDDEVERISIEIARFRNVSSDVVEAILLDFREAGMVTGTAAQGGVTFARETLEAALGPRRADEVMMKVEAAMEVSGFRLLQTVETEQLVGFLQHEPPQTIALILAHLHPRKAADVIASLPDDLRSEVVARLATLGETPPELMREVEEVIRQQIGALLGGKRTAGGVKAVAQILNNTSRSAERDIMEALRDRNPDLAGAIKDHMFVFDDLIHVGERDLQRVLMEVDQRDLALALKAAPEPLKEKLLANVSERAAETIREEIELMGPARISDVEDAQRRVLEKARDLEEQQEVTLSRTAEEVML